MLASPNSMNTMMAVTLMVESQYSIEPKLATERLFT